MEGDQLQSLQVYPNILERQSPIVCQYQKHVQNLEPDRRYGEEVDGHHVFHVVFKERTSDLRWRPSASNHVLAYAALANVDPQF